MKPFVWILLAGLFLAPPGLALKDTPASPEPDSRRSDLSNELGAFVREALNEGLLDPAGTADAAKAETARKALEAKEPAPAKRLVPVVSGPIDCTQPYPLDFSEFESLSRYSDIYAYREESVAEAGAAAEGGHTGATLARAYLSLDLASEAAMTIKTARDQEAVALQNLAILMEGHMAPPVAYFTELAACYPEAALWRALALVSEHQPEGAALLETNLSAFRQLPLQLRDRAAMIAIPALDGINQRTLAKLLLAAFSEEEIANSAQLRFSAAVLGLGDADAASEELIRRYLVQARFQEVAMAALIRHERKVNPAVREILVDDMVNRIELAQQNADVRDDLRFVLDELSAASMYVPMMRLAELPSMQTPAAQEELARHLVSSLQRDLASDDSLRNIAAIEALIKDEGLLEGMPERQALFENATIVSVRLGFGSLGDTLATKAKGGEGVAEQRAVLAYRQKNLKEVYDLAGTYPANQKINLIAARSAIAANDGVKLPAFESRLRLEPDTILMLIEDDAASGNWIVSEKTYQAAMKLEDDAHAWRVDRVMLLKRSPASALPSSRIAMSSIPGKLDQSRQSLAQLSGETP